MGVGKTSVCQELKRTLDQAVFLDGDWCWDADPFQITDETKAMVLQNICYLLNQFIHCSAYQNIIFCWVMHEQSIIDTIIERLDLTDCTFKTISLVCDEKTLVARLMNDIDSGIRNIGVVRNSVSRLGLYKNLHTTLVSTEGKSIKEVAKEITQL